jgi:phosphate-selective porin
VRSRLGVWWAVLISGPLAAQAGAPQPGPVRITGYVQARFNAVDDSAAFLLRRARIGAQGGLTPWASFKVQVETRAGGTGAATATVGATDLYLALADRRWTATVGQFKTPFSREFITSSTVIELAERALVVDALAPNRDIGFMIAWASPGRATVQAGVFNGEGTNRASNRDSRFLYVGRVVVSPAAGVDVGAAAAGAPDSTGWAVEASVRHKDWTLRAEYLARDRAASANDARGWYALAAHTLPVGRLQLVGRVEQFDPTSAPDDRTTGYTGGLQYYFRGDDLKLLGSYTVFDEQGASVANNRVILQLQGRF